MKTFPIPCIYANRLPREIIITGIKQAVDANAPTEMINRLTARLDYLPNQDLTLEHQASAIAGEN